MIARSMLIAVAAALVSSAALAAAPSNPLKANAQSNAGTFIAATLCSGGPKSFDCRVSPTYTRLMVTRRTAAVALSGGRITPSESQFVLKRTDQVRSLLDQALATCVVDGRTGNCTNKGSQAEQLLARAKSLLK